jgi:Mn2+/Fe2+ NRAMP family transporter
MLRSLVLSSSTPKPVSNRPNRSRPSRQLPVLLLSRGLSKYIRITLSSLMIQWWVRILIILAISPFLVTSLSAREPLISYMTISHSILSLMLLLTSPLTKIWMVMNRKALNTSTAKSLLQSRDKSLSPIARLRRRMIRRMRRWISKYAMHWTSTDGLLA